MRLAVELFRHLRSRSTASGPWWTQGIFAPAAPVAKRELDKLPIQLYEQHQGRLERAIQEGDKGPGEIAELAQRAAFQAQHIYRSAKKAQNGPLARLYYQQAGHMLEFAETYLQSVSEPSKRKKLERLIRPLAASIGDDGAPIARLPVLRDVDAGFESENPYIRWIENETQNKLTGPLDARLDPTAHRRLAGNEYLLAKDALQEGDRERAKRHLVQAVKGYFALALVYRRKGDPQKALAVLREQLRNVMDSHVMRAFIEEFNDPDSSDEAVRQVRLILDFGVYYERHVVSAYPRAGGRQPVLASGEGAAVAVLAELEALETRVEEEVMSRPMLLSADDLGGNYLPMLERVGAQALEDKDWALGAHFALETVEKKAVRVFIDRRRESPFKARHTLECDPFQWLYFAEILVLHLESLPAHAAEAARLRWRLDSISSALSDYKRTLDRFLGSHSRRGREALASAAEDYFPIVRGSSLWNMLFDYPDGISEFDRHRRGAFFGTYIYSPAIEDVSPLSLRNYFKRHFSGSLQLNPEEIKAAIKTAGELQARFYAGEHLSAWSFEKASATVREIEQSLRLAFTHMGEGEGGKAHEINHALAGFIGLTAEKLVLLMRQAEPGSGRGLQIFEVSNRLRHLEHISRLMHSVFHRQDTSADTTTIPPVRWSGIGAQIDPYGNHIDSPEAAIWKGAALAGGLIELNAGGAQTEGSPRALSRFGHSDFLSVRGARPPHLLVASGVKEEVLISRNLALKLRPSDSPYGVSSSRRRRTRLARRVSGSHRNARRQHVLAKSQLQSCKRAHRMRSRLVRFS